ncbi:hypothetical protein FOZ63_022847, partial [Perkinsus olseni]
LSEQKIDEAFADFIVRYQKKYHSEAERNRRRGLFAKTLMDVVAANEGHDEAGRQLAADLLRLRQKSVLSMSCADINAFADLSAEDFAEELLCGAPISTPNFPIL